MQRIASLIQNLLDSVTGVQSESREEKCMITCDIAEYSIYIIRWSWCIEEMDYGAFVCAVE